MDCPVCTGRLRTVEKYGVEIDICPDCKGVWLDRGELDKIIELVSAGGPDPKADYGHREEPHREEPHREIRSHERDSHGHEDHRERERSYSDQDKHVDLRTGKPRRGSWLADIFESFGGGD